jgi:hypothetical protein
MKTLTNILERMIQIFLNVNESASLFLHQNNYKIIIK